MNNFKLRKHSVKEASFIENREKEKKNNVEISVEGGILIPKDFENSKYLAVQLKFSFGNPEERLYLILETLSTFEIEREGENIEISEEGVRAVCLPVALAELRKTVKKVTEAYGIAVLDLPPFEEETIEK
jgi:hypothetical protein